MDQQFPLAEITSRLEAALADHEMVAQATLVAGSGRVGSKMLVFTSGVVVGSLGMLDLDDQVRQDAAAMMAHARGRLAQTSQYRVASDCETQGEKMRVFIEVFPPPPHLVIFGGVHVAVPLVSYAKTLGFRVTVADPRAKFANAQRFPEVDAIIPEWPDKAAQQLVIGPSTYCVILTHDPKIDEPALEAVLGKNAAYVGAIGSRKTHRDRFGRMAERGVSPEALGEVYAPIGLDLNAETPEEIALAIMAEIVAVRRGGTGGFMRESKTSGEAAGEERAAASFEEARDD